MKPTILVFCSWLFPEAEAGDFFIEQSDLVSDSYTMILVVFKKEATSIKKLDHRKKSYILEKKTNTGLCVLEVHYPTHKKYPEMAVRFFKRKTLKLLHSHLQKNNIDASLIHAQSIFDAGIWAYEYFLEYKTPYLLTEHNQLTFFKVGNKKCELVKNSLQNAKKICVVSNDKARQFFANGLYHNYYNIGNLVHERFNYLPRGKNATKRLITVGAYHFLKDQKTIFKALSLLDKHLNNKLEFVWIGFDSWGGDLRAEVAALSDGFSFKNIKVILIPVLGRAGIVENLQSADAFVFSSLSEGMPVSVLEALACGLPVFTSNCGGVDEIIDDSNGHIYPIQDSQRLANLLEDFLNGKMEYESSQISKNIISRFGPKIFKEKLIKLYQDLT